MARQKKKHTMNLKQALAGYDYVLRQIHRGEQTNFAELEETIAAAGRRERPRQNRTRMQHAY